ncbi:MAG TPA: hypothetical protein VK425_08855, partial [Acidimicrobiales bacterium]|nr:hypothetical protein [Acidimicrobiales bacterium]
MTPGGVVYLATPGATENYLGNWLLDTQGTSLSEPVTLEPAPGVASPILNGNNGSPFGCQTVTCDGTVFAIGYASEAPVYAVVQGVTFEGAILGAMANEGVLTVMNCTFSDNAATAGAGIYNDTGLLYVSGSTFVDNTAMDGGAIYDAEGLAYVTTSTFYSNTANVGGAIKTDYGPVIVWASTFSANTANMYGNTIDDQPNGIVQAAADIFDGSCNQASGTEWDDEGYNVSSDATCLNAGQGDVDHNASLTSLLGVLSNNGGPTETML